MGGGGGVRGVRVLLLAHKFLQKKKHNIYPALKGQVSLQID